MTGAHALRANIIPNPLGAYALTLSLPSYLIHGTNKPAGVGMRSSHGCIRLANWDVVRVATKIKSGDSVSIH